MQRQGLRRYLTVIVFATLIIVNGATAVVALSSSTNYQMVETDFTAGSSSGSCSGEYCTRVSIGGSTDRESTASFEDEVPVDSEPRLEVIVDGGESSLGGLTTEATAHKTTTVRIRTHLSDGYTLQILGDPPKFNDYTLKALDAPTESRPGTEQFGLNIVANTSPNVGLDPSPVDIKGDIFDISGDDYLTPNLFKYISGDVVARTLVESGQVDYTISMIVNVSNMTPAGHYSSDFSAVVTPIY